MAIEKEQFRLFYYEWNKAEYVGVGYENPHLIAWHTGEKYQVKINDEFGLQAQARDWCIENCAGPVSYLNCGKYGSSWFFYNEDDAMAFKLKWT
jgi:hypothetical protein